MSRLRSHVTLILCTILHAFTHGYSAMLVPLYVMVQGDLRLPGVAWVSRIVTIYGVIYFLLSYFAGMLADRFNRKVLLGIGLLGNAAAILAMGLSHQYWMLLVLAVLAGIAGTVFHPAANAMVPAHYPDKPGMAMGLLSIGSGLGFWAGPQFAGWRAQMAGDWHRPMIEAGAFGLVIGVIFLFIAKEATPSPRRGEDGGEGGNAPSRTASASTNGEDLSRERTPSEGLHLAPHPSPLPVGERGQDHFTRSLMWRTIAVAVVLSFRDFAGVAGMSLLSIFLAKAWNQEPAKIGFIVGTTMLSATVVNPIAVALSPGRRRLPALSMVLVVGAIAVAMIPFCKVQYVLPVALVFMAMQLGSYALSDAATIERVTPQARGRVVGLFLLIAGTFSSTGPWIIGWWTDHLGPRGSDPHAYTPQFFTMAVMMLIGAASSPFIARLGKPGQSPAPQPLTETAPATMPAVG